MVYMTFLVAPDEIYPTPPSNPT